MRRSVSASDLSTLFLDGIETMFATSLWLRQAGSQPNQSTIQAKYIRKIINAWLCPCGGVSIETNRRYRIEFIQGGSTQQAALQIHPNNIVAISLFLPCRLHVFPVPLLPMFSIVFLKVKVIRVHICNVGQKGTNNYHREVNHANIGKAVSPVVLYLPRYYYQIISRSHSAAPYRRIL